MKQFFKFMFASVLGTLISLFLLFFIGALIIVGVISAAFSDLDQSKKITQVEKNSILYIQFDQPIVDRGPEDQFKFDFGNFASVSNMGLDQILENIEKAKDDENIEGIYLDLSFIMAGMASVEEIRNALLDFKTSGKWIVSYSEIYTQKAFYLASVADELYLYPEGMLEFSGLSADVTFFKGMLDKLQIEPQIIRGSNNKFKSAVEPFINTEMSEASEMQTRIWLSSLWNTMLDGLSGPLDITPQRLAEIADEYQIQFPEDAVSAGFATALKYNDEVVEILKQKTGIEADKELKLVKLEKYFDAPKPSKDGEFKLDFKKDKIAVIYATGPIESGEGDEQTIGSETMLEALREARKDTSIKAIVLRVNSPGGSALASDVIWRETILAKKEKPLVVSMGDVAASGGYYISAAADKIYAMPNTITGSIGVFGIIPNMKGFFNDKLGMTFDGVKTSEYADFPDLTRPLSESEMNMLQRSVDRTYSQFLTKVSEGRNIPMSQVDSLGQGRVWSGKDALSIGLVDELGGLEEAIAEAARLAGIEDYKTKDFPERKDPFQKLMEDLNMAMVDAFLMAQLGGDEQLVKEFKEIRNMKNLSGIQARVPYRLNVD